jgi:hypothetical protein
MQVHDEFLCKSELPSDEWGDEIGNWVMPIDDARAGRQYSFTVLRTFRKGSSAR